jgi:hypothetical protein
VPYSFLMKWWNTCHFSPRKKCKGAKSLIILVCWMVWCERNRQNFYKVEKDWGVLVSKIQGAARQWIKAVAKSLASLIDQSSLVDQLVSE